MHLNVGIACLCLSRSNIGMGAVCVCCALCSGEHGTGERHGTGTQCSGRYKKRIVKNKSQVNKFASMLYYIHIQIHTPGKWSYSKWHTLTLAFALALPFLLTNTSTLHIAHNWALSHAKFILWLLATACYWAGGGSGTALGRLLVEQCSQTTKRLANRNETNKKKLYSSSFVNRNLVKRFCRRNGSAIYEFQFYSFSPFLASIAISSVLLSFCPLFSRRVQFPIYVIMCFIVYQKGAGIKLSKYITNWNMNLFAFLFLHYFFLI